MTGDLRDDLAAAVRSFEPSEYRDSPSMMSRWRLAVADAVLAVLAGREAAAVAEVEAQLDERDRELAEACRVAVRYSEAFARARALADEWEREAENAGLFVTSHVYDLRRALDGAGDGMPNISGTAAGDDKSGMDGAGDPAWTLAAGGVAPPRGDLELAAVAARARGDQAAERAALDALHLLDGAGDEPRQVNLVGSTLWTDHGDSPLPQRLRDAEREAHVAAGDEPRPDPRCCCDRTRSALVLCPVHEYPAPPAVPAGDEPPTEPHSRYWFDGNFDTYVCDCGRTLGFPYQDRAFRQHQAEERSR